MKPKTKAPRVRWAKVANPLSRNPAWRVVVGRSVASYEPCWELADSVARAINAELSRLVAARERRKARPSSAFERDLTSILDSAPTRKLVKAEAKRRAKKQ